MDGTSADPLLLGLAAGDERAFAVLYDRFATRMFRTAIRMLRSREDAEDVVQEVFLAVMRSRAKLDNVRDLTAYLFTALHRAAGRCAARRERAPRRSLVTVDEVVAPAEQAAFDGADWQRLQQAMELLPDEQRTVVTLRIDGELTFGQIAEVMGLGVSTVASRYQYALRKLKTSLVGAKAASKESR